MSVWTIGYLAVFALLCAAGLWNDYYDRQPAWFLICVVLSNLTVIYLFVAFWNPLLRAPNGWIAPVAYVAAMIWELFQAVHDTRSIRTDPEFTRTQQRGIAVITTVVYLITCLPAFVIAGLSAFKP